MKILGRKYKSIYRIEHEDCVHDWEKWDEFQYYFNNIYTQVRYCKECGEGEIREVKLKNAEE